MLLTLLALWPLFALIIAGYLLQQARFFSQDFWSGCERLNYFFLFPALLISSLTHAPLTNPQLPQIALLIVLCLLLSWIALLFLKRHYQWPASRFGVLVQGALRFNTYLGLATITALFGKPGLAMAALIMAVKIPLLNILSVWALASGGQLTLKQMLLPIIKNPLIIACLIGILLNLSQIGLPWGSEQLFNMLGAASLPLGLLCVGAALQPKNLLLERQALLLNSAAKLLALPALAAAAGWLMGLPSLEISLLVLFFALPTAPSAYILARQMGGDSQLMAGIITLQTLLAAISLPIILLLVSAL